MRSTAGGSSADGKISPDGRMEAARATVQQNVQVHIDDYVWIGLKGMTNLIDARGCVNILVTNPVMDDFYPADINTSSPYGYYRVALLPGPVHLDGVHALQMSIFYASTDQLGRDLGVLLFTAAAGLGLGTLALRRATDA